MNEDKIHIDFDTKRDCEHVYVQDLYCSFAGYLILDTHRNLSKLPIPANGLC